MKGGILPLTVASIPSPRCVGVIELGQCGLEEGAERVQATSNFISPCAEGASLQQLSNNISTFSKHCRAFQGLRFVREPLLCKSPCAV
jgi:hypothetical protein